MEDVVNMDICDEIDGSDGSDASVGDIAPIKPKKLNIPKPEKIDVTFISDIYDVCQIPLLLGGQTIPTGKCRIRVEIERI